MKISRTFVKLFLGLFLVAILAIVIIHFFGMWNQGYLLILCPFTLFLFFPIYRKKENGILKFFKFIMLIISLGVILYIFYSNFFAYHEFNYFYDIGSEADIKNLI